MPIWQVINHISVGAGFENDRRNLGLVAAHSLAQLQGPRYIIYECLAERTLANQVLADSLSAQVSLPASYIQPCWAFCKPNGIRIVSNVGGIDPLGVAEGLRAALGADCSMRRFWEINSRMMYAMERVHWLQMCIRVQVALLLR